ncbi:hypothetical protein RM549_11905 [Salegentibacter sp. F188]|uniref:Uncharacterized protein n=1 Tax=Autumnicola patrickiae TaxID=3075591 RepID=A0ABU3E3L7_9FLAO|nr:hypothetical protein [Salegentibacter sp. F188]MDT0690493.1 hypothetical protein [Salegentibacter sp. F188]
MALISQEEFKKITDFKKDTCVSIFIPTQRGGKEVLEQKNKKHLKSTWDQVKRELESQNVSAEEIKNIGKPIEDLLNKPDFWRHQSDGLAIFSSEGFFEKYTVPVNFEAHHYISNHFYIKPLAPLTTDEGRFYLLAVQQDKVEFFEATKNTIGEVYVEDLTPSRLEDRVGYDYEEKNRKTVTQNSSMGTSTSHGYDAANRDDKNEILRFFNAIDKGLKEILHDENVPLVVACQDYLFPIYKEANSYKNLFDQVVPGNPSDADMFGLHEKALKIMEPHLEKKKRSKLESYGELTPDKTSSSISDIVPAAFEGKVDTLFLENRSEIWGSYDEKNRKVEVREEQSKDNTSLMNLAAAKVIETGGSVFLIESAFMPDKEAKVNAIFRYS